MPKGLTATSSLITVSFRNDESAANTFTQTSVDLQLNPLDNEVFVVYAIDLETGLPDAIAATDTNVRSSLSTTSRTTIGTLADSNVLAVMGNNIRSAGFADGGVAFSTQAGESPPSQLEYIGIIATNDFFLQVQGNNNLTAKNVTGKIFGARMKASSSVYAALVQSEVLS